jgi:outer membrane scaffolding protein for murein synthesis (MipA/OmpV family)
MTARFSRLALTSLFLAALIAPAHATDWQASTSEADLETFFGKLSNTSKWNATLGIGTGFAPKYEGSDRFDFLVLPVIDLSYDNRFLYANTQGLGVSPLRGRDYHVSFGLGYDMGRYESDDRKNLRGLDKVDASLLAVMSADYTFMDMLTPAIDFKTALLGDYATTIGLRLAAHHALSQTVTLLGDGHTTWGSEDHMRAYFGVTPQAAARSGKSYYNAKSGFENFGFSVGAKYALSTSWNLRGMLTTDWLVGEADKSPVSVDSFQPSGRLSLSYTF